MARAKPQLVAFNAGEFGAEALARVDLQNYPRGGEIYENVMPLVQGGLMKAPGTQYIASTPSDGEAYLRPFIFSNDQRFSIELSENKLRLVFEDGLVTLTGATATLGAWSDESGAADTGGDTAPGEGNGGVDYDYQDPPQYFDGTYA